jgi:glycosyltransferase involved in cell wall biosynthesis
MSKIIWVPLEQIDTRYTKLSRIWFTQELEKQGIPYIVVEGKELSSVIGNKSSFLNTYSTIHYKSSQIEQIAEMFNQPGKIEDGDVFMVDDIWMPGIEGIRYMAGMTGKNISICGIYHAGGNIPSDDVATKLGQEWTKPYERSLFEMCNKVFVGSEFHKKNIENYHKKKFDNLFATGIWFNSDYIKKQVECIIPWEKRQNIILFPHRLHPEKKPGLFDKIEVEFKKKYPEIKVEFVKSIEKGLTKQELYELMARSKIMFSAALQENFGYATLEACVLGCRLLLPNRVVYSEFYSKNCLYELKQESPKYLAKRMYEIITTSEQPKGQYILQWVDKSCARMIEHLKELM